MSYILDALQRADAERARGTVPGLHTHQLTGAASHPSRRGTNRRLWMGIAAVVLLGGVAAILWLRPTPASEPSPDHTNLAPEPSVAAAPSLQSLPQALPQAPPIALAPAAIPAIASKPIAATPALAVSAPVKMPLSPAASPAASNKTGTASSAATPLLAELSEDLRRQIPGLTITGAVYSAVPAQRMLLVNGLVLKQGDAAADLVLEEIGASASMFSYRGVRFRVAH